MYVDPLSTAEGRVVSHLLLRLPFPLEPMAVYLEKNTGLGVSACELESVGGSYLRASPQQGLFRKVYLGTLPTEHLE